MKPAWAAILLTWLVTAAVAVVGARSLGARVREQIVRRDAEILQAMARTQAQSDDTDGLLAGEPFAVFVTIGRFDGIVAARMYDSNGVFLASVPDHVREADVPPADLTAIREGRTVSRFRADLPIDELFLGTNAVASDVRGATFPAVEVLLPLPGPGGQGVAGLAGFVLEGSAVQREFALLDRRIRRDVTVVVALALGLTGAILYWAFSQLDRSRRLIARRTEDLQQANRELARSARVASLGAITAHLVHGLRNPVSGLQSFVASGPDGGGADAEAWEEAKEATRRMQATIQQVVRVLRDHESGLEYDARLEDVAEAVLRRSRSLAESRKVGLVQACQGEGVVDSRRAGLLALLLTNLVDNGIEATPPGGRVSLELRREHDELVAEVRDQGPGLAESVRARLFEPKRSTKDGGSGLGLAITRQLALALGGEVAVASTGPSGTVFRVRAPMASSGGPDPAVDRQGP